MILLVGTLGHKDKKKNPTDINVSKKGSLFTQITAMSKIEVSVTVGSMPLTKSLCLSILSLLFLLTFSLPLPPSLHGGTWESQISLVLRA